MIPARGLQIDETRWTILSCISTIKSSFLNNYHIIWYRFAGLVWCCYYNLSNPKRFSYMARLPCRAHNCFNWKDFRIFCAPENRHNSLPMVNCCSLSHATVCRFLTNDFWFHEHARSWWLRVDVVLAFSWQLSTLATGCYRCLGISVDYLSIKFIN